MFKINIEIVIIIILISIQVSCLFGLIKFFGFSQQQAIFYRLKNGNIIDVLCFALYLCLLMSYELKVPIVQEIPQ